MRRMDWVQPNKQGDGLQARTNSLNSACTFIYSDLIHHFYCSNIGYNGSNVPDKNACVGILILEYLLNILSVERD